MNFWKTMNTFINRTSDLAYVSYLAYQFGDLERHQTDSPIAA